MGFHTGAYATMWEVKSPQKGNFLDSRITISRKNSQTNQYETDFSSFVRLVGLAAEKAKDYGSERHRIKIGDCDVSNRYDKEKNITYTNYVIFDFEDVTNSNGNTTNTNNRAGSSKPLTASSSPTDVSEFIDIPDGVDEELPFN